ncbi:MAG: tRNA uridine-5-carboxymethylaminomethyl(34) synthesis GTPase MnmE [Steroidobacteraceae bacterium]
MSETIAALATPAGRGGVGIVRISGPAARHIAHGICSAIPQPRVAQLSSFAAADGSAIDTGLVLWFPGPQSYTGEDVLELHGHGGPMVLQALLERVLELGARRAQPGEFTQRAFLNDKLDLAQAEAVADLIDAGSTAAARAAVRSLQGAFSQTVHELVEALIALRMWVEAAIDFPEEDVDFLADATLQARLLALREQFDTVMRSARTGRALRDGLTVVIAGRPNAGKSSLLNALCGHEAAIVTDIPGTTRDVLREQVHLEGLPVHLIDTAGLRPAAGDGVDPVETEGIRRARAEMARADRVLFVVDASVDPSAEAWLAERDAQPAGVPVTVFFNKQDRLGASALSGLPRQLTAVEAVFVGSALSGAGLAELRQHLQASVGFEAGEGAMTARARHLTALAQAREHAEAAFRHLIEHRAGELVAEELRAAQRSLDDITGEFHADELLGRIFGSFCIGK